MNRLTDPEGMAQDQQLTDVAAILAVGFLRYEKRMPQLAEFQTSSLNSAKEPRQFTEKELDSSGDQSLHCDAG